MRLLVCPSRVWRPVHGTDTQLADVQLADTQLLKKELPPGCSFSSTWHGLPKEDDLPVSFLVPSLSHTLGEEPSPELRQSVADGEVDRALLHWPPYPPCGHDPLPPKPPRSCPKLLMLRGKS